HGGGFAGAIGPEQSQQSAFGDTQGDVVDGNEWPETPPETAGQDHLTPFLSRSRALEDAGEGAQVAGVSALGAEQPVLGSPEEVGVEAALAVRRPAHAGVVVVY